MKKILLVTSIALTAISGPYILNKIPDLNQKYIQIHNPTISNETKNSKFSIDNYVYERTFTSLSQANAFLSTNTDTWDNINIKNKFTFENRAWDQGPDQDACIRYSTSLSDNYQVFNIKEINNIYSLTTQFINEFSIGGRCNSYDHKYFKSETWVENKTIKFTSQKTVNITEIKISFFNQAYFKVTSITPTNNSSKIKFDYIKNESLDHLKYVLEDETGRIIEEKFISDTEIFNQEIELNNLTSNSKYNINFLDSRDKSLENVFFETTSIVNSTITAQIENITRTKADVLFEYNKNDVFAPNVEYKISSLGEENSEWVSIDNIISGQNLLLLEGLSENTQYSFKMRDNNIYGQEEFEILFETKYVSSTFVFNPENNVIYKDEAYIWYSYNKNQDNGSIYYKVYEQNQSAREVEPQFLRNISSSTYFGHVPIIELADGTPLEQGKWYIVEMGNLIDGVFVETNTTSFKTLQDSKIIITGTIVEYDLAIVTYDFVKNDGNGNVKYKLFKSNEQEPISWTLDRNFTSDYFGRNLILQNLDSNTEYKIYLTADDGENWIENTFTTDKKDAEIFFSEQPFISRSTAIFYMNIIPNSSEGMVEWRVYKDGESLEPEEGWNLKGNYTNNQEFEIMVMGLTSTTNYTFEVRVDYQDPISYAFQTKT